MLSKEELERVEHAIKNFNGKAIDCIAIGQMLVEYKQLETKEQKLIEKLEEYADNTKKQKLPNFKTVAELIKYKGYAEGKLEACKEILSMIKGEEKNGKM